MKNASLAQLLFAKPTVSPTGKGGVSFKAKATVGTENSFANLFKTLNSDKTSKVLSVNDLGPKEFKSFSAKDGQSKTHDKPQITDTNLIKTTRSNIPLWITDTNNQKVTKNVKLKGNVALETPVSNLLTLKKSDSNKADKFADEKSTKSSIVKSENFTTSEQALLFTETNISSNIPNLTDSEKTLNLSTRPDVSKNEHVPAQNIDSIKTKDFAVEKTGSVHLKNGYNGSKVVAGLDPHVKLGGNFIIQEPLAESVKPAVLGKMDKTQTRQKVENQIISSNEKPHAKTIGSTNETPIQTIVSKTNLDLAGTLKQKNIKSHITNSKQSQGVDKTIFTANRVSIPNNVATQNDGHVKSNKLLPNSESVQSEPIVKTTAKNDFEIISSDKFKPHIQNVKQSHEKISGVKVKPEKSIPLQNSPEIKVFDSIEQPKVQQHVETTHLNIPEISSDSKNIFSSGTNNVDQPIVQSKHKDTNIQTSENGVGNLHSPKLDNTPQVETSSENVPKTQSHIFVQNNEKSGDQSTEPMLKQTQLKTSSNFDKSVLQNPIGKEMLDNLKITKISGPKSESGVVSNNSVKDTIQKPTFVRQANHVKSQLAVANAQPEKTMVTSEVDKILAGKEIHNMVENKPTQNSLDKTVVAPTPKQGAGAPNHQVVSTPAPNSTLQQQTGLVNTQNIKDKPFIATESPKQVAQTLNMTKTDLHVSQNNLQDNFTVPTSNEPVPREEFVRTVSPQLHNQMAKLVNHKKSEKFVSVAQMSESVIQQPLAKNLRTVDSVRNKNKSSQNVFSKNVNKIDDSIEKPFTVASQQDIGKPLNSQVESTIAPQKQLTDNAKPFTGNIGDTVLSESGKKTIIKNEMVTVIPQAVQKTSSPVKTVEIKSTGSTIASKTELIESMQNAAAKAVNNRPDKYVVSTRTRDFGFVKIEMMQTDKELEVLIRVQNEHSQKLIEQVLPEIKTNLQKNDIAMDVRVFPHGESREKNDSSMNKQFSRQRKEDNKKRRTIDGVEQVDSFKEIASNIEHSIEREAFV